MDVMSREKRTHTHIDTHAYMYILKRSIVLSRATPFTPFAKKMQTKKKRNKRIKFGERVRGRSRERRRTVSKNKYRILGSYK